MVRKKLILILMICIALAQAVAMPLCASANTSTDSQFSVDIEVESTGSTYELSEDDIEVYNFTYELLYDDTSVASYSLFENFSKTNNANKTIADWQLSSHPSIKQQILITRQDDNPISTVDQNVVFTLTKFGYYVAYSQSLGLSWDKYYTQNSLNNSTIYVLINDQQFYQTIGSDFFTDLGNQYYSFVIDFDSIGYPSSDVYSIQILIDSTLSYADDFDTYLSDVASAKSTGTEYKVYERIFIGTTSGSVYGDDADLDVSVPSGGTEDSSDNTTVVVNNSTDVTQLFRDILSKISPFDDYVFYKIDDKNYRMYVGDIDFLGDTFNSSSDLIVYDYCIDSDDELNIYVSSDLTLLADNTLIYSNLGFFPDLIERGDYYALLTFLLLCTALFMFLIRPIFNFCIRSRH